MPKKIAKMLPRVRLGNPPYAPKLLKAGRYPQYEEPRSFEADWDMAAELEIVAECGDRVMRAMLQEQGGSYAFRNRLQYAVYQQQERIWNEGAAARQERAEYNAQQQRDRDLLRPRWVTTRARNYRHILFHSRHLSMGQEKFCNIACPNQIVVHLCDADEIAYLPVCPRCAAAQLEVVNEAELQLPDGTRLPQPERRW